MTNTILHKVCAACRQPSPTCKLVLSDNGRSATQRCKRCRDAKREAHAKRGQQ